MFSHNVCGFCRYLQWLIEDQDSDDPEFHSSYALLLTKSALETYKTSEQINGSDPGKHSIFQNPVRERLQVFLQSSDLYDPELVLDLIDDSELWLEKVCFNGVSCRPALFLVNSDPMKIGTFDHIRLKSYPEKKCCSFYGMKGIL